MIINYYKGNFHNTRTSKMLYKKTESIYQNNLYLIRRVFLIGNVILLVLLELFSVSIFECQAEEAEVFDCSIINLIATPEKYNFKKIRVIGFAIIEFEEQTLYLSENDAKYKIIKNGIWLDFKDAVIEKKSLKMANGRYVIVKGVFDMNMLD